MGEGGAGTVGLNHTLMCNQLRLELQQILAFSHIETHKSSFTLKNLKSTSSVIKIHVQKR